MRERDLVTNILRFLKKEYPGWWYKSHDISTRGIPDILGVHQGYFFAIEVKTKTGRITKIQEYTVREILDNGGCAFFARDLLKVKTVMKQWFSEDRKQAVKLFTLLNKF